MKSTGIVRKIDDFGRLVIPKEIRKVLNLNNDDFFEISMVDGCVLLKKHKAHCIFCKESNDLITYKGYNVCSKCKDKIKKQF